MGCCTDCYELIADACTGLTLTVATSFTEDDEYIVWVTDKFGNIDQQTVTVDANGDFTLDLALFTDSGYGFNPYSGSFFLTVSTSATQDTGEIITIGGENYTCIKLNFKNITSTN
jgi:hypothetical protein